MTQIAWRGESISRIVLGTAQLGFSYGISNERGQPDRATAREMIREALAGGIGCFDTARAYGESEAILGETLAGLLPEGPWPQIVSKLDPASAREGADGVRAAVASSLRLFGGKPLFCYMLHWAESLRDWDGEPGMAMREAREEGMVRFLGVSCYTPAEARRAMACPGIDAIQIPFNAWDQRMLVEGVIAEARERDVAVFARSIFLQGLLLMDAERVHERLPFAAEAAAAWQALVKELGTTAHSLAARSALAPGVPLVIGAAAPGEVGRNARLAELAPLDENEMAILRERMAPHVNERILNPAKW